MSSILCGGVTAIAPAAACSADQACSADTARLLLKRGARDHAQRIAAARKEVYDIRVACAR